METWETEEGVAADERGGLVDSETHTHFADEQKENGAWCLGTPQQKEPRVRFSMESSNSVGSSDQDHQKELRVKPIGEDHKKKCR